LNLIMQNYELYLILPNLIIKKPQT
jgi:hypothetical protein